MGGNPLAFIDHPATLHLEDRGVKVGKSLVNYAEVGSINYMTQELSDSLCSAVEEFAERLEPIMTHIKDGKDQEARQFFNESFSPMYREGVWTEGSALRLLCAFFCNLDEYLNNS